MKKLQVQIDNQWLYVFCRNNGSNQPVTTDKRDKALPSDAVDYFKRYFSEYNFRTI